MNTLDALQIRKSVRGYLDKPVEPEKLQTILKYGNKAPNAGPFHVTVITNRELIDELDETTKQIVRASDNEFLKQRFSIPGYRASYGAPVVMILSAPQGGFSAANCACAVTNMGIAAAELGLGSCYLAGMMLAFSGNPELTAKCDIPDGFAPQCGFILGYASDQQIPGKEWVEDYSNISYVK